MTQPADPNFDSSAAADGMSWQQYILTVLAIALGYYATGRVGVSLAIPPGFATAVWPPSGIALAGVLLGGYRCWPGVFIGSFLINVFIAFDNSSTHAVMMSCLIAGGIASGAALQALAGAWLVRYAGSWPTRLETPYEVGGLLFWGAASCTVNATISTLLLSSAGISSFVDFGYHWMTWWVGDVVGVLAFAPVLLLNFTRHVPAQRKRLMTAALLLTFALAVYMFVASSRAQQRTDAEDFHQDASQMKELLAHDIKSYKGLLDTIAAFYMSSEVVTQDEFQRFTAHYFSRFPGLAGLSWNQKVTRAGRAAYEKHMSALTGHDFYIRERVKEGKMARAGERDFYFPVTYIAQNGLKRDPGGFDTYAEDPVDGERRRIALDHACDTGEITSTGRVNIVQEDGQPAILFYRPVYRQGAGQETTDLRREALVGYIAGVFIVPRMAEAALAAVPQLRAHTDFLIRDTAAPEGQQLLYDTRDIGRADGGDVPSAPLMREDFALDGAAQHWVFEAMRMPVKDEHPSWYLWAILVGGLLFTGLLSALLLMLTGRTAAIQREVEEKTDSLVHLTERLMRANTELERFAYVASHDMQEPIRMISSFSSLLQEEMKDTGRDKELRYLRFVGEGALRLRAMIEDLLEYARAGAAGAVAQQADMNLKLEYARANLAAAIEERGAEITADALPPVWGNAVQLTRLLQNLVSNALKYQAPGRAPRIHIGVKPEDGYWHFTVADNGIGIAQENLEKVFEPFKRLHSWNDQKGTGLGLAICRTIVENHQGRIWAESVPGEGAIFHFTLPMAHPDAPAAA